MKKLISKINKLIMTAAIIKDQKASPAIETAALITFIGLIVITKADGVADAIGGAFDRVITGITNGLGT